MEKVCLTLSHFVSFFQVLTNPHATLRTAVELCGWSRPNFRQKFQGIFFKFKVAVVTENSSIGTGEETNTICK